MQTKNQLVEIKGQKDGLWIYLDDQETLDSVFSALDDRLRASNRFFAGAEVMIDTGTREIAAEDQVWLRKIVEHTYGLHIKEIQAVGAQSTHTEKLSEIPLKDSDATSIQTEAAHPENSLENRGEFSESPVLTEETPIETIRKDLADASEEEDAFMNIDATFQIPVQQTWEESPYSSEHLYENEETAFIFEEQFVQVKRWNIPAIS